MQRMDWVAHGLKITHTVSHFVDSTLHRGQSSDDVVRLHFGLRGDYRVRYPQLDRSYYLVGGHHNIFYAKDFQLEFVNKTPSLETFGVQFPVAQFVSYVAGSNDVLSRFCERIEAGKMGMLFEEWGAINPAIEQTIRQIMECRYVGGLEESFLLSKSLDLLVLSVETARPTPGQYLKTEADRDRIVAARDRVNERLTDPPTLTELAKLVGINEYKLKRGFKEMFGTTTFAYLTAQRLDLAKQYLLDTDRSATEIASDLGYATPQHFHSAFKKRFGVTPNSMRKAPQGAR
jgi:AraC family transcriptional regulator, transcriptional activator of the genes for pyochelin and ferripyochelin receptors